MRLPAQLVLFIPAMALCQTPTRMEIVVEKKTPAGIKTMDPEHIFEQGDLVRFRFKSNFAGYLYVMNQSTSGKSTLLFPKDETGRENKMESGREYLLPASGVGWFKIEGPAGHEIVYWVVSPTDLSVREPAASPSIPPTPAPSPDQLPPGVTPRCDDTVFRARGDCVDTSAGVKPVPKQETVPDSLSRFGADRDQDLIVARQQNRTTISSPDRFIGPVIYQFHLAHK